MADSNYQQRKQKLLDRYLAGAIDKAAYDEMAAQLEQMEGSGSGAGTGPESKALDETHAHRGADVFASQVGDQQTVVGSLGEGADLGGFRIEQQIGKGGMGEVWKAYDQVGDRHVVIKVLPPQLQGAEEEMARVKETFSRVHDLQHQHICPTYLLGQDARVGYFLVMKFLDAVTLSQYRRLLLEQKKPFGLADVLGLLRPVAEALDYAHSRRIVHRDIKPQNVLVSRDGQDVQVVDFGLAAQIRTSISRVSQVRMDASGTYPYMAPEQWKGEFQDGKVDQYALAAVAFELLTGRLPFDAADAFVLRQCVLNEQPPTPEDQPHHVARALLRGMAKQRHERFNSCCDLVDALAGKKAVPPPRPGAQASKESVSKPPPIRSAAAAEQAESAPPEREPRAASGQSRRLRQEIADDIERAERYVMRQGELRKMLEKTHAERMPAWKAAADAGVAEAQFLVGGCREYGVGGRRDPEAAAEYYRKAAAKNYPLGIVALGMCYQNGSGLPTDHKKAVSWFRKAADREHPLGQWMLGRCYAQGSGVQQDLTAAVTWFRRAAENGLAPAQFELGRCLARGIGLRANPNEAAEWFEQAADQGHKAAAKELAKLKARKPPKVAPPPFRGAPPPAFHRPPVSHQAPPMSHRSGPAPQQPQSSGGGCLAVFIILLIIAAIVLVAYIFTEGQLFRKIFQRSPSASEPAIAAAAETTPRPDATLLPGATSLAGNLPRTGDRGPVSRSGAASSDGGRSCEPLFRAAKRSESLPIPPILTG